MTPLEFEYIRDPHSIEKESFRQIRQLTDLSRFDNEQTQVAMRLVHTCGDPAIADNLEMTPNAVGAGLTALAQDAAVLCDVEMVKQGLTKRFLEQDPLCFLNHPDVPNIAKNSGETRTMAALELWQPHLAGGIVLIGNAPTALFRLQEMLFAGCPKPALIIGMPVGFVGAAESKQALMQTAHKLDIQAISLSGRAGGSALTAATFNTLLRLSRGISF